MPYRADIDGLRALAVLPITLFHAGIPGFGGGYVGVDIFFVISGYLITSIIVREIDRGTFSFRDFYERRIRRIFPALLAMLAFTTAGAFMLLLPTEMVDYSRSLIGALLFTANIVFYFQSGYFVNAAEEKPLLHTWSLGVEEQFYIFFPALLLFVSHYMPHRRKAIVAAAFIVSLAMCLIVTPLHRDGAFYLAPMRAWELLAGALLAFHCHPPIPRRTAREGAAALGLIMVIGSFSLLSDSANFPGWKAMLPVMGSALVIAYAQDTLVGRALSLRPMVFIGLISYSLYLWHWPLIVFGRLSGVLDHTLARSAAVVLLSVAVAYCSYRIVEHPARNRAALSSVRLVRSAAIASIALTAVALFSLAYAGLPQRYPAAALAYAAKASDFSPKRAACHIYSGLREIEQTCVLGGDRADTALWADSHGVELGYALASSLHPLRTITYSGCPPSLDFEAAGQADCSTHNRRALDYLVRQQEIRTVILTAYYTPVVPLDGFAPGFLRAVAELLSAGKRVIVIGPTPGEGLGHLPNRLARNGPFSFPRAVIDEQQGEMTALFDAAEKAGASVIDLRDHLCGERQCQAAIDGNPVLFDTHHMSLAAARHLAPAISRIAWPADRPVDRRDEETSPDGTPPARLDHGSAEAAPSPPPSAM